ncbi:hypothetical protein E4T38_09161 [Aureobasidium subglaciale]|nr:hypothetical protein E4T38_09161 [Aureobasidium subglaciale]KAI5214363.1 hypothetical protein E4T40_09051 [Aureobasidium subglaciale]KAI5216941.1 hypothetical protein E4T41_09053 [Aureobasidium subglaciale]KAI5253211.1 hypothetical protein E4T46_09671 [Aureobasidium subglaciale]
MCLPPPPAAHLECSVHIRARPNGLYHRDSDAFNDVATKPLGDAHDECQKPIVGAGVDRVAVS